MQTTTSAEPRLGYVMCADQGGAHRMAWWGWGDPANPRVLLCVHGLTRSGRDFDALARHLSAHYHVVCPDVVGRGKSDWLAQPKGYAVTQYVADMLHLIARLNVSSLDWVGTSMGGLIGMALSATLTRSEAARPARGEHGLPATHTLQLGKMVLNDVGPRLDTVGITRIASYVGQPVACDTFEEAIAYMQQVSAGFGLSSPAQWEEFTRHAFIQQDGRWVRHYDLRIAEPMQRQPNQDTLLAGEAMLWHGYEALQQPVLIIHGEQSDLLQASTVQEMLRRNQRAQLYTVAGVGHAPSLMDAAQIERVSAFLLHDTARQA